VSGRVGLVLLAAGASTRLGRPKQLLDVGGRTLLRHMVETALESPCRPVAVVLGYLAERMARELAGLDVQRVVNADWVTGQGSSLSEGVQAIQRSASDLAAVTVMLVDQPAVTARHLTRLVEAFRRGPERMVASSYDGVLGAPALFPAGCFPALLALRGSEGARELLRADPARVRSVPFQAGSFDVDEPGDASRLDALNDPFTSSWSSRPPARGAGEPGPTGPAPPAR